MIVTLIAALLVLAVAYFQMTQGLFSAMITAVLTVLCAALAFSCYEGVAAPLLYARQGSYADAICLAAMFLLPLIVLRFVFDVLVHRNVYLGTLADRAGGALFGALAGMVMVGMVLVVAQMLPFGRAVLDYRPYDAALRRVARVAPFCPDDVAVGVGRAVSAGALSGPGAFYRRHRDLLLESFCARNTAGLHGSIQAAPDALQRAEAAAARANADWTGEMLGPGALDTVPPHEAKLWVLRVAVDSSAADEDGWWRLPGTHFRLVTKSGHGAYPVGFLRPDANSVHPVAAPTEGGLLQLADLVFTENTKAAKLCRVEWVYRLAAAETPDYVVFRRVSARSVTPGK